MIGFDDERCKVCVSRNVKGGERGERREGGNGLVRERKIGGNKVERLKVGVRKCGKYCGCFQN